MKIYLHTRAHRVLHTHIFIYLSRYKISYFEKQGRVSADFSSLLCFLALMRNGSVAAQYNAYAAVKIFCSHKVVRKSSDLCHTKVRYVVNVASLFPFILYIVHHYIHTFTMYAYVYAHSCT